MVSWYSAEINKIYDHNNRVLFHYFTNHTIGLAFVRLKSHPNVYFNVILRNGFNGKQTYRSHESAFVIMFYSRPYFYSIG